MSRLNLWRVLSIAGVVMGLVNTANAQDKQTFCASQGDLVQKQLGPLKPVGWVVMTLSLGEQPCFFAGGEIEKGGAATPDGNTVFELASVTKIFTTAILAMRQRQNSLDVMSPVKPDLPPGYAFGAKEEAVTFQQLATFTGGFHWSNPPGFNNRESFSQTDFVKAVNNLVPKNPVGETALPTKDHYSNSSVGLLGQVLAYVDSGKAQPFVFDSTTFSSWISTNLTGPLNMNDTAVEPGGVRSKGYNSAGVEQPPFPWQPWGAAGALRSTANDMLKFLKANICAHHATDSNCTSLPANILKALEIAHQPNNYSPPGTKPIYIGKGTKLEQAWAWSYLPPPDPNPNTASTIISKDGGHPGFSTLIAVDPDISYGLVILTNTGNINVKKAGLAIVNDTVVPASIQSIDSQSGPLEGGATVTIKGDNLNFKDKFEFDGKPATKVVCSDTRSCTMLTPMHKPGDITVLVSPAAAGSAALSYKYLAPQIKSFSPKVGPTTGGLSIGITGVSLSDHMTVNFGARVGKDVFCGTSTTNCSVTSPAGMMPVNLTVTVDTYPSDPSTDQFTFVVFPTVTDVIPATGAIGSTVAIDGTGFSTTPGGTTITFSGLVATGVTCTKTRCSAVVPGFSGQTADVEVTVDGYTSLKGVTFTNSVKVPPPPPL